MSFKKMNRTLLILSISVFGAKTVTAGGRVSKDFNPQATFHFKGNNFGKNFFASEQDDHNSKGPIRRLIEKSKINCLNSIEKVDVNFNPVTSEDIHKKGVEVGWNLKGKDLEKEKQESFKKGYIDGIGDSKKIVDQCYNKYLKTMSGQNLTETTCLNLIKTCIYENMLEVIQKENKK